MAYTATHTQFAENHPIFARIGNALKNFGAAYVDARSRGPQIRALNALTDEQLAARGIKREDIVRHVFADSYII